MSTTPKLDYVFDEKKDTKCLKTNKELLEDIYKRCHKYVPGWKDIDYDIYRKHTVAEPLCGGLTNHLYKFILDESLIAKYPDAENLCVVRVFGNSEFTHRATEVQVVNVISACKLSEAVYHEWSVGRIASYIPGQSLMPEQFAAPRYASVVSPRLGQLHALDMSFLHNPETSSRIIPSVEIYTRSWLQLSIDTDLYSELREEKEKCPEDFIGLTLKSINDVAKLPNSVQKFIEPHFSFRSTANNDEFPDYAPTELPRPTRRENMLLLELVDLERMKEEADWMLTKFQSLNLHIDFCHNDCHGYNCMYMEDEDPSKDFASLIDYEFAGLNYRGFDIGNSLAETTIRYTGPYPYFHIDMERQLNFLQPITEPGNSNAKYSDFESTFINGFITGCNETKEKAELPHPFSTDDIGTIDSLALEAAWLLLGSHLQWTLWSIPLADKSTIDFGYMEYAILRLSMYLSWKEKLLALEAYQAQQKQ